MANILHSKSVKVRLVASLASNGLRAALSFLSNLIIARALSPAGYGNLMFLLNSLFAVIFLLDLGSSNAFYTFISQRSRSYKIYLFYYSWVVIQFLVVCAVVLLLMPHGLINKIWLGQSKLLIILAFAASFLQQRVWQTISQVGEAKRKTVKVQLMTFVIAIFYLTLVVGLIKLKLMSVTNVLIVMVITYSVVTVLTIGFLGVEQPDPEQQRVTVKALFAEFWGYCSPLVLLSLANFLYNFFNTWLLQRFSGSIQQAFFQIGNQFTKVSLLATTSVIRVFWKEVAEANHRSDLARVKMLYKKFSRSLVTFGAVISGFLIPWAKPIVMLLLGHAYLMAWPIVAIIFLYPIHQSLGQVAGVMFLASERTRSYSVLSFLVLVVPIPVTYFVLAPASGALIPGLALGALGIAIVTVITNVVSTNIMAWFIARYYKWRFDWLYQLVGIGIALLLGFGVKSSVLYFWPLRHTTNIVEKVVLFSATGIIYCCLIVVLIWALPWLLGLDREELKMLLRKCCRK